MSAVTLETLRADFKAALELHIKLVEESSRLAAAIVANPYLVIEDGYMEAFAACCARVRFAFDLYEIALSAGTEADGLNAAMLYKLSDGNLDPRKGEVKP